MASAERDRSPSRPVHDSGIESAHTSSHGSAAMNRLSSSILVASLVVAPGIAVAQDMQAVQGDVLLIERVREEPGNLPRRGMSMAQVEAQYGAPSDRLDPRGGQKRDWPTINRWTYPTFTVYFERSRVIDVVMTKADPNEIGPKPPTT